MPAPIAMRGARAVATALALCTVLACATSPGAARASATIAASLSPDRLHAKGALTLTIDFGGDELATSAPVRKLLLKLPSGLGMDVPSLRSCSAARLRARGPRGCPTQSKIGSGHALVQAHAGSQLIDEHIALWVFLGTLHNFQPTFEVLGRGDTPLQKQAVLSGTVISDHAPYGEAMVMDIPAIPTLPLEPDASMATLTLTIGTSSRRRSHSANTVVVPGSCPAGGFPFAAEFTYADGSAGSALTTAPCPR